MSHIKPITPYEYIMHAPWLVAESGRLPYPLKGVFSPNRFFLRTFARQLTPYELTHLRPSPGDCAAGLAGRKRHARFESSEALAELPAVARTAVKLHGCCARVSLAAALLSQHIDGVARAGSAGTKSVSGAHSLV